ncbi:MAG TPA: ABC transporter ATP-binding protein [Bryobacteraceae bacterium]|nr:ABC transporter ATP-binding protein [Bryobacteraceae bacterium]
MTASPPARTAAWSEYGRLKPFLHPYTGRLIFILAISLLATALGLVQPYISKLLIDTALLRRDWRALVWVSGLMFLATVFGFLINILSSYQYVRVSAAMLFDMRLALYRHLQTLSPRFYAKWRLGDLVSRLNNDIGEVQRVSADTLLSVLSNVTFLVGSIAMMLWLNWRLFLLSIALVPLCLWTFAHYQQKLTDFTRQLRERAADLGSLFVETIIGMRTVIASNAADHEAARFRDRNTAFVDTLLRLQVTSFLTGALPGTILTASTALVFLYGGKMIIDGTMSIGALVAFMAYHMRLLSPVQTMMGMSANLAAARVSLSRIFEILDTPAEVTERPNAVALPPLRDKIVLEDITLRHDRENVLNGVSFEVKAGTFCAILGPSGAGKSTIADLLVRLLDPDSGRITIDGADLRDLRLEALRSEVVLVDQTAHLFNASIAENIAYAQPKSTRAQIESAGTQAGLDELIRRLPEGYDTKTGERGLALSAGERQRIALARALLRKPSVLILDEPTSALDPETEKIVARNLREALISQTVIIITHRPALAEIADQVVTLRDGKTTTALAPA